MESHGDTTFKPGTRPDEQPAVAAVDDGSPARTQIQNQGQAPRQGANSGAGSGARRTGRGCRKGGELADDCFVCAYVYDQTKNKCHKITGKDFLQDFQKELASFIASSSESGQ